MEMCGTGSLGLTHALIHAPTRPSFAGSEGNKYCRIIQCNRGDHYSGRIVIANLEGYSGTTSISDVPLRAEWPVAVFHVDM